MKFLIQIIALFAGVSSSYGWMHLIPDHKKQYDASDLVAVVRVLKISNTGVTNRLDMNSRLLFREIEVEMEIQSLFKGEASKTVKCSLFRFPTETERNADFGEREARSEYLKAAPWESGLFIPQQRKDYLVYLKHLKPTQYLPVGGHQSAILGILEITVPFTADPDQQTNPKQ